MLDPNPDVDGRGVARLRDAGIRVDVGCLEDEARQLNEAYIHWIDTGRPFVILKAAMTVDGKIATATGQSRWITGEKARQRVHRLRSRVDAVMVGIGTVLHDDPQLTARLPGNMGRQPARVVVDSRLRLPRNAKVLTTRTGGEVIVATTARAPKPRVEQFRRLGATVLVLPAEQGRVSLSACLAELGKRGITSILLEGGSEMNASAARAGLVDRLQLYVAPAVLGGRDAKGVFGGAGPTSLADAIPLGDIRVIRIGGDILLDARVLSRSGRTHSDTRAEQFHTSGVAVRRP